MTFNSIDFNLLIYDDFHIYHLLSGEIFIRLLVF